MVVHCGETQRMPLSNVFGPSLRTAILFPHFPLRGLLGSGRSFGICLPQTGTPIHLSPSCYSILMIPALDRRSLSLTLSHRVLKYSIEGSGTDTTHTPFDPSSTTTSLSFSYTLTELLQGFLSHAWLLSCRRIITVGPLG